MPQNRKTIFIWLSGGIFVIALLVNLRLLDFVPNTVISLSSPIIKPVSQASSSLKASFIRFYSLSSQIHEVGSLRREVASLRAEIVRRQVESQENSRLRILLDLTDKLEFQTVTTEIITWDSSGAMLGATINSGQKNGIVPGQAVLDEHGNLAGIIETVFADNSYILFITDDQAKVDAGIVGKDAEGLASGSHGVGMEIGLLSQEAVVEHNDTVVTAGISGNIPPGIPIGVVDEILSNDTELFKRASLVPYANIRSLGVVMVVLNQRRY